MKLFLILFFLSAPQALSKTEKAPSLKKARAGQLRPGARPSAKPSASQPKGLKAKNFALSKGGAPRAILLSASQEESSVCDLSGENAFYSEESVTSDIIGFFEDSKKRAGKDWPYIKAAPPRQCPEACEQIDSYEGVSKVYPVNTHKGSCKGEEAKELYLLDKKFPFQLSQSSVERAHQGMKDWIFSLFVDPHYPFASPSKEFIESGLGSACPSCSFYLDYTYKYTKEGHVDLLIQARCGDKREFFPNKFKVETSLINRWSCRSKPKAKDKI